MGKLVPKGAYMSVTRAPPRYAPEAWGQIKSKNPLHRLKNKIIPDKFAWDDLAQQVVGALVLSAPLAVTAEVWELSVHLDTFHVAMIVGLTLLFNILLLYFAKFQIVEQERILGIIPLRLFSQMVVAYTASGIMLYMLGVIGYEVVGLANIAKLIIFVGLFSNIGAGAADLLK